MSNQYQKLKKQHYLSLLQECARSGKNKREWCAQAGVKYSTLMRWQGLLRDELAGEILSGQEICCGMNWQEKFFRARRLFRYRSKSQVKKYLLPNRIQTAVQTRQGHLVSVSKREKFVFICRQMYP